MREIRLYGFLGQKFGRVHRLAVKSTAEAVRALCCTVSGFEQALIDHAPGWKVWTGTTRIGDPEDLHDPSSEREVIRIAPVVAGAKSAFGQILIGVALVAAAFFTGGASLSAYGLAFSSLAGQVAFGIGAALVLGGVAQMLAPHPKSTDTGDSAENKASYIFNGAVNTVAQGNPVPVGYGRMIVGSAVISAGLSTQDYTTA